MHLLYLIPFYAKWHYTEGLIDLFSNWRSFVAFVLHFFSLGLLVKTLFAPFGRLDEEYRKGFDAEAYFETLVANTLMRVVGFVLRTFVIIIGVLVLLVVIVLGPITLLLWVFAPFIIISLFSLGVTNLLI